ncbi:hypothetical protein [Kribbella sp. NPDC051620]|uniref:hypothetical protein n=1 Tax=Kribbella sp. NPDC051620 TaxID=3364120 RepID=UPI0037BAB092
MTAQQNPPTDPHIQLTDEQADPIGPISLPKRSRIGSRALALVGAASVLALGANALIDQTNVTTTVSVSAR